MPPFTGVAVNVADVPVQMVLEEVEMLTLTGRFGLTVIVVMPLVAGLPETHVPLEVRITFTVFPLAREELVKTLLLVPTFTPPICH